MSPIKNIVAGNLAKIRLKLRQLVALRASKHEIALGFGVGVFVGVFPTFGLGAIAIAILSPFFKFNIPAALIGTLIANPFTTPLWVVLSCWVVGLDASAIKVSEESLLQVFRHYSGVLGMYSIGISIVSIVSGLISYFITRVVLQIYYHRKKRRMLLEKQKTISSGDNTIS